MNRILSATILHVEEGSTVTLTAGNAEQLLDQIKQNLTAGSVLVDITDEDCDDEYEIVADMTEADPLAGLSVNGATDLIVAARELGYTVPSTLTPERFLEIYYAMYPEAEEE